MKKIIYIFVIIALMLLVSGCNLVTIDEAKDAATVIATVDDYQVTKAEFNQVYNYYIYYYQVYVGVDLESEDNADTLEKMKGDILDMLVQEGVKVVKARQNGCYEFTADEQAQIDADVQETLDYYKESLKSDIETEQPGITEDELATEIENRLPEYLKTNYNTSEEMIRTSNEDSVALQKLYDQVTTDVEQPSEDAVRAAFDQKATDQQTAYEEGSSSYEQLMMYGQTIYYVPEGVRKAKHILIALTDEQMAEISDLRDAGDDDSADAKRDEYLAEIKEAADAAYQRAASGEDFDALITELGEDPGMESNEYYAVMSPSSAFAEEFSNGLFTLENVGDITEPVPSDFGYHIIQYFGDVPTGPVDYETVRDAILAEVYTSSKDEYFTSLVETWQSEMKIKTYPNRID